MQVGLADHHYIHWVHLYESGQLEPTETWCFIVESLHNITVNSKVGETVASRLPSPFDEPSACVNASSSHSVVTVDAAQRSLVLQPKRSGKFNAIITSQSNGNLGPMRWIYLE